MQKYFEFKVEPELQDEQWQELEDQIIKEVKKRFGEDYSEENISFNYDYDFKVKVTVDIKEDKK